MSSEQDDQPTEVLEATLDDTDQHGRSVSVTVRWIPLRAWGIDRGRDDMGEPPTLWASENEPPIRLVAEGQTGFLEIEHVLAEATGDYQEIYEAYPVNSADELEAGYYYITEESL